MGSIIQFAVGKTRSGKILTCPMRLADVPKFLAEWEQASEQDRFDVVCMFEYMVSRELRRNKTPSEALYVYSNILQPLMPKYPYQVSVFQRIQLGRCMVNKEFRD